MQAYLKRSREKQDELLAGLEVAKVRVKTVAVPPLTRITQALFALFMVGIFAYVAWEAKFGFGAFEPRAALFPWVIGLPSLVLALFVLGQDALTSTRKVQVTELSMIESEPEVDPIVERQRTLAIGCWIVGFFLAIWVLGFVPASAVATFLYLKFGAGERWPITLAISAGCWLFFFGLFDYALQLPFPQGALFEWLPVSLANLPQTILG
jgi:hypothetical protein